LLKRLASLMDFRFNSEIILIMKNTDETCRMIFLSQTVIFSATAKEDS
jgi:superfamily II DNA/RNA helicase